MTMKFTDWSYENCGMGYQKAYSVSLKQLAAHYDIHLENESLITCPFPSHQGGNERTGSFKFFEETNTYHCYGCQTGNSPIDFVMNLKDVSRQDAISIILAADLDSVELKEYDDCLDILVEMSEHFKKMMSTGINIDFIMQGFDETIGNGDWERERLERTVHKLKSALKI